MLLLASQLMNAYSRSLPFKTPGTQISLPARYLTSIVEQTASAIITSPIHEYKFAASP
jgi:hypothetical protein